jgi:filamentous hemagglutinin
MQINKFFSNNLEQNKGQLFSHLDKADLVPLDYRNLTPENQSIVNSWISALPADKKDKIIIIR